MKTETLEVNWHNFYKDRVNSPYQEYFNIRYKVMIGLIKELSNIKSIKEEGIGIGSLAKALKDRWETFVYAGTDISNKMLELANENLSNNNIYLYHEDILSPRTTIDKYDLILTHGVLEHFDSDDILSIWDRQRLHAKNVIAYVPLDKYQNPSFGDERLLPYEHWVALTEPTDYVLFNNNHDLLLIN